MSHDPLCNWPGGGTCNCAEIKRPAPDECPHCEYDRGFPGFEAGGWIQQDNNGPIVSCPLCNPNGDVSPRP